jgi:putative redox protein
MKYLLDEPIKGAIGPRKYQVHIRWRKGSLIADEPEDAGGMDTGPDPYSLLLSSLAACTLATLRMYIDRKNWSIDELEVRLNLFQEEKEGTLLTVIDRDLHFPPGLPEEQRTRLLEVADKCPISKILKGSVKLRNYEYRSEETDKKLQYSNGEITVVWKPDFCKHSGRCVFGLPDVFNIQNKPWINMEGADSASIIRQVEACPTGALSWHQNEEKTNK